MSGFINMKGSIMKAIRIEGVSKKYDGAKKYTLQHIDFSVNQGEFIVLLGPSGCGKSTLLRIIAGLESLSSGTLIINDKVSNLIPPSERGISMVFQEYALYPHLTVYENIAFGLRLEKVNKDLINEKVKHIARIVELTDYLDKMPKNLSGGQRQRVAIARALVRDVKICLLDEPFSNLDAKLRVSMRTDLKRIHNKFNLTSVFVTHDQIEAMNIADRIIILNEGKIQQVGKPLDIYNNPQNLFVANFFGSPTINSFDIYLNNEEISAKFVGMNSHLKDKLYHIKGENPRIKEVVLCVRPENIELSLGSDGYHGKVKRIEFLGADVIYHVLIEKQEIRVKSSNNEMIKEGDTVSIQIKSDSFYCFDAKTQNRIL